MTKETAHVIATSIAIKIKEQHADYKPQQWNPMSGQWLVYSFERFFGFAGTVELEAIVERAWRAGEPIVPAIEAFLNEQAQTKR